MGASTISGGTPYQPSLPSYRIGNELYSISCLFKVDIVWLVNAYSSHSIPNAKGGGDSSSSQDQGGHYMGCKGMVLQSIQVGSWR
jgi:hypothetical protein